LIRIWVEYPSLVLQGGVAQNGTGHSKAMKSLKRWADKLNNRKSYEVKPAPIDIAGMKAGQIMLVPSAKIVDDAIREIPEGTSIEIKLLRQQLAAKYHAQVTCPITTGFHLRTVAEAAFEALREGNALELITPFWRVLDERSPTTKRLSFGSEFVSEQRRREGIQKRL
jgi:hypothetical protein